MKARDRKPVYDYFNQIFAVATQQKPVTGDELVLALEQRGFVDPPNRGNGAEVNLRLLLREWQEKTGNVVINVKKNKSGRPYGYFLATTTEQFDKKLRELMKKEEKIREKIARTLRARNSDVKRSMIPVNVEYDADDYQDYLDLLNSLGML